MAELLAAGVRPPEEAFLSELKGAASTKRWEDALRLLDGLREAGYQPRQGAYACAIRYVPPGVVWLFLLNTAVLTVLLCSICADGSHLA